MIGTKIEYTIDNFSGLIEVNEDYKITWSTFPLHSVIGVYFLYNENKELLTTGYSMLVFVDRNTGRPILPPDYVSEKIKAL